MKSLSAVLLGGMFFLCSCVQSAQQECVKDEGKNAVIETIMTRRSVRQYQPQAVNRDTMQIIMECGINAPNAVNRQAWEVRVVDNPEVIQKLTELYVKDNPKAAEDPNFKNMFRNAPTVVFIANDTTFACLVDGYRFGMFRISSPFYEKQSGGIRILETDGLLRKL